MNGHTIVGDGTAAQLAAMLTGVSERDNPEARRGFPGMKSLRGKICCYYQNIIQIVIHIAYKMNNLAHNLKGPWLKYVTPKITI